MRLQLMWIESVLGHSFLASNLLLPCSLTGTSDTELSGIHWSRKVSYLKCRVSHWSGEKQRRWRDTMWLWTWCCTPPTRSVTCFARIIFVGSFISFRPPEFLFNPTPPYPILYIPPPLSPPSPCDHLPAQPINISKAQSRKKAHKPLRTTRVRKMCLPCLISIRPRYSDCRIFRMVSLSRSVHLISMYYVRKGSWAF